MKRVRLYFAKGIGVIAASASGVLYSNQAGGTSCLQPELEGIYIPLDDAFDNIEHRLLEYFEGPRHLGTGAVHGLDVRDADYIDSILPQCLVVDRTRLASSMEAWVHVRLRRDVSVRPTFEGFEENSVAVLTWANSD
jgi:hypothetical protein